MCKIKMVHATCVFFKKSYNQTYVYFSLNNMVFFSVFILQYITHMEGMMAAVI